MAKNKPIPSPGLAVDGVVGSTQRDGVLYASAARGAATYVSPEFSAPDECGLRLYIDITNVNGGTLTLKIQTKDPASGNWVDLAGAVTTALAAATTTRLTVFPGITAANNLDVSSPISGRWRISMTVAAATMTFSVGGEYLAYP